MACEPLVLDGKVVGIMCGVRKRKCTSPGCGRPAEFLCDYPLRGARAGKTCSRGVCSSHRVVVADGVDHCPAHGKVDAPAREAAVRVKVELSFEIPDVAERSKAIEAVVATLGEFAKPREELKASGWKCTAAGSTLERQAQAEPVRVWRLHFEKGPT